MFRKVPLIVILGSTGTGKTKLSLQLAERFAGEIISADSMQIYANLDIVTAKATKAEQATVKHHLLDIAKPSEPFTVFHFRNAALPIIEDLLAQSKCPIVVGGTNYYIESLLWDILIDSSSPPLPQLPNGMSMVVSKSGTTSSESSFSPAFSSTEIQQQPQQHTLTEAEMSSMESDVLHGHLRNIDPITADRIHPNNKRKIIRALEVYQLTGQKLSTILEEQRSQPGGNRLGGPLRYPHTILLWLRCNQEVLNDRLDKRVDSMLKQGLLREIRAFYNEHLKNTGINDYTKGVLQTIGIKEFTPYLDKYDDNIDEILEGYLKENSYTFSAPTKSESNSSSSSSSSSDDLPPGLDLLHNCLNELKLVTRRYSKTQTKWIKNRLLGSKDRKVPDIYQLDSSDPTEWNDAVYLKAVDIIDCYRSGQMSDVKPMEKIQHPGDGLDAETSNFCEICKRHFVGDFQWQLHMRSNRHKRKKAGLQRRKGESGFRRPETKESEWEKL